MGLMIRKEASKRVHTKNNNLICFLLVFMLFSPSFLGVNGISDSVDFGFENFSFVSNELILKFKDNIGNFVCFDDFFDTGVSSLDSLNMKYSVVSQEKLFISSDNSGPLSNYYRLKFSNDEELMSLISDYESLDFVEFAEPNYVYNICKVPNDPRFSSQWGLDQSNDCDIDVTEAWDIEVGSSNVVVAVVDTGVDYNHPDLAGNCISGYDFVNNDDDPMDDHNHGTHCAGIIGAVGNNNVGISGVCWDISIMPVKCLNSHGSGTSSGVAESIIYAADNGADVISMSLGGGYCEIMENAVDYAYSKGVVIIAAAGNSNSNTKHYPAAFNNVISVAATNQNDNRAHFSTYGDWVDIAAPGVDILSTLRNNNYGSYSGTSMACPHVAGLAGLLLSKKPSTSKEEIKTILRSTTDAVNSNKPIGTGRINAREALKIISKLEYSPEEYDFGKMQRGESDSTSFEISSSSQDTISFSLSTQVDWLSVSPNSGSCSAENPVVITVTIDTSGLSDGVHIGSVDIDADDAGSGVFEVSVKVGTFPSFDPSSGEICLEQDEEKSTSFEIWNEGVGTLDYWLKKDNEFDWIHFSPTEGSSSGERNTIDIIVNSTNISKGYYICNFTINSNSQPPEENVIATREVTNIRSNSATLQGELFEPGWDIWFRYKKKDSADPWTNFDNGYHGRYWGPIPHNFSMNTGNNLLPNTTYIYQACADNNKIGPGLKIKYGANRSFKTPAGGSSGLAVSTLDEENLSSDSVTLVGRLDDDGGFDRYDLWFQYKKRFAVSWDNVEFGDDEDDSDLVSENDSFRLDVSDLSAGTEYVYRAVVDHDNEDYIYGDEVFFETVSSGLAVSTKEIPSENITSDSVLLEGILDDDGDEPEYDVWFEYKRPFWIRWWPVESGDPLHDEDEIKKGDTFNATLDDLDSGKIYWYRAVVDDNKGNFIRAERKEFTTKSSFMLDNFDDGAYVFSLHIYVGINSHPVLDFSPESHNFGEVSGGCGNKVDTNFNIKNVGDGILEYNLVSTSSWLSVNPDSGSLSKDKSDTIEVVADLCGLNPGESYHGDIEISSDGGNGIFGVDLKIAGGSNGPDLSFYPKSHDFGYMKEGEEDSTSFEIWNGGSDTLTYELSESVSWITNINPSSGESSGERDEITVTIDTSGLSSGESYHEKINIKSNGDDDEFDVYVEIAENLPPVFENENPVNGAIGVSLDIDKLEIDINDPNGDRFSWSIETVPDIGRASGSSVHGGRKSCSVSGLEPSTSYIWYVNASDSDSGLDNKVKYHFMTKQDIMPNPTSPSPHDEEKDVGVNCVLSWECGSPEDDFSYDVYFGEDENPPIVANRLKETSYHPEDSLKTDTYYYWRIVAWSENDKSTSGALWSFKTKKTNAPSNPKNPSPIDNSDNIGVNCVLSWSCDDLEDTLSYDVYFGESNNPSIVEKKISVKSYNPPGVLEFNTKYYWKVVVWNNEGKSAAGPIWCFTTTKDAASVPSDPNPSDGEINVSIYTSLDWKCDAISYDVYIGKDDDFITPEVNNITTNYYNPSTLEVNTRYYWKVVAWHSDKKFASSDVWSFNTGEASSPPENADIEIVFPRRICWAGVKADIKNIGNDTISNVSWSITVRGGLFGKVNISETGVVDILNSDETSLISTWDLDLKSRIVRRIGKINVVVAVNTEDKTNVRDIGGFVFGRIVWLPLRLR